MLATTPPTRQPGPPDITDPTSDGFLNPITHRTVNGAVERLLARRLLYGLCATTSAGLTLAITEMSLIRHAIRE